MVAKRRGELSQHQFPWEKADKAQRNAEQSAEQCVEQCVEQKAEHSAEQRAQKIWLKNEKGLP